MKKIITVATRVALALVCALPLMAQQHFTVEWKLALQELEQRLSALTETTGPAVESWRADAEELRSSIALFRASHSDMQIDLPEALPASPAREALSKQLAALNTAVDQVIRQSPGSPFHLGHMTVTVTADAAPAAAVADSIDKTEIESHNVTTVAKALDLLPGVSIQHIASNRNEAGIMVRGFSSRGQVPLYLDGVPIYVPYDGYVDFNRFLTSDISELQVSRGYSSPLLGPNALGGSVNLVTKQPVKLFEGDAVIGTASGDALLSSVHLGARRQKFFVQGSLDWLQSDFIPLSGNFAVYQYKNLPHISMTDHLNQSDSRDEKFSGRAGWTPRREDEYVLSYSNQKGRKGVPLYQGPNTNATFKNFWVWPYWDADGYYFHSNTGLGESSSLKVRAFYNQFRNSINMYSDDTYTAMNTKSAEHSIYDEHTDGVSAEFFTRSVGRNAIGASFFLKNDTHKEHGIYPGMSPYPLAQHTSTDQDQQISIGLQDAVKISTRFNVTAGFSADHLNGQKAQSYNTAMTGLVPFTCVSAPANTSFSGCTAHIWNFNPQVSASYVVSESGKFFFTFADRGRFPMLKDTYTASMGAGLPNPDLKAEHSRNWNAGYSQIVAARTSVQVVLFRSDLRNAIESVYVTDPGGTSSATAYCPNSKIPGFCSEMANLGKEVHEGVEFELQSTPFSRVTLHAGYSYLNRSIVYDYVSLANVSRVNTSVITLPTLPKNKITGTASVRLPHQALAMASVRYEGGITLQDTTYASTSPLYLPHAESYGTMDLGVVVPIRYGLSAEAGVKNLFDRNYYYTAGYPEEGRNWYVNFRYRF